MTTKRVRLLCNRTGYGYVGDVCENYPADEAEEHARRGVVQILDDVTTTPSDDDETPTDDDETPTDSDETQAAGDETPTDDDAPDKPKPRGRPRKR